MSGNYTIISTFAGGGGSSIGYKLAGYNELLAIEYDKNACETLRLNFPDLIVLEKDITKIKVEEIYELLNIKKGELDILDGSPPCQGFSTAGKRNINDARNYLFESYCYLLKELQPKVFIMENVSGLIKGKMKGFFKEINRSLIDCGYNVKCKLMNAMYYNVPQSRERLFFLGIRNDIKIEHSFPMPNKKIITVKEAFENIKNIYDEMPDFKDKYALLYNKIPQGKGASFILNYGRDGCRKLNPKKPSFTIPKFITGRGFATIAHYAENRAITVNEAKRLCSFPDDYILIGSYQEKMARLGNAVMPNMMKAIAENIKINILDKYYGK